VSEECHCSAFLHIKVCIRVSVAETTVTV